MRFERAIVEGTREVPSARIAGNVPVSETQAYRGPVWLSETCW